MLRRAGSMRLRELHDWDVSPSEAVALQKRLRPELRLEDEIALADVRLVAGIDNAYLRRGAETVAYAVVVVLACCRGPGRLPVPAQMAHNLVSAHARMERASTSDVNAY